MAKQKKERIDNLLVQRGFVPSRAKAKAFLIAGLVIVNDEKVQKAGQLFDPNIDIRVKHNPLPFVSRAGLKLQEALNVFQIDIKDQLALDVGASTGGFTDCMLQQGAQKVWALDCGTNQLVWQLRNDDRVVSIEKCNIRHASFEVVGSQVDIVTIDVSFISLTLVIPAIIKFLKPGGKLVALIKPQFEVGKDEVEKGGVIRDEKKHEAVIAKVKKLIEEQGFTWLGLTPSPIKGKEGNKEFLCYAELQGKD